MKRNLLITAMIIGITGCSTPKEAQLTISPKPTLSETAMTKKAQVVLGSRDLRTAQFVAVVDNGRKEVQPLHTDTNLRLTLENALAIQMNSLGFNRVQEGQVKLRLDLLDALVKVKHSLFSHSISTNVQIQLVAQNKKNSFVKRYTGQSTSDGPMSASTNDMEKELNSLLEAVLNDIAKDTQLITFMTENT